MLSSESGLSYTDDPLAIVSDDEIAPEPEIFTSDTESDPDMLSDDDDDFQPFTLPHFGDDLPLADGIPEEDPFVIPIPVHDHLIIGHPDGEHIVAPILAHVPLMVIPPEDWLFDDLFDDDFDLCVDGPPDDAHGDGELDEDVVASPLPEIPVIEISSDSSLHYVSDSFESVTSSALQAVGLRRYATDSDDDAAMSAAPPPPHELEPGLEPDFVPVDQPDVAPADPEPIPNPEPLPDHDPIPFGIPDIAPLIPDRVPAPVDPPVIKPFIPPLARAPADVAPFLPVESDVHRVDLPIVFLQDISAPRPGEGTSGQQPSHDSHVSAAFPHIPQSAPLAPFTSSPLDEPFRWFPPYTMPISDPYHPSHFAGYTWDDLLLSPQLQFEIMSRRILELEMTQRPLPCPCQPAFVPPRSSPSPFSHPPAPLTPFPEFDTLFLTVEQ
ncbi:autism susceptibility gene 2 protein homolog [Helianthus annuus]|uniref:autism susceptibility gene 2 protein homolog n=1 Tax=Helianthus annuus TaxID=4232 RepID=UPI000B90240E|nr:autism susceptibility gene 2 protein homolog [Helianthus annuus]